MRPGQQPGGLTILAIVGSEQLDAVRHSRRRIDLVNLSQAAKALGLMADAVRQAIDEGRTPAHRTRPREIFVLHPSRAERREIREGRLVYLVKTFILPIGANPQ